MTDRLFSDVDSNETAYNVQLAAVQNALRTYGTEQIEGVRQNSVLRVLITRWTTDHRWQ